MAASDAPKSQDRPRRTRWVACIGALLLLEVVARIAGLYAGWAWVLRLFLYPQALMFVREQSEDEVHFRWLWAGTLGVLAVAFCLERALASGDVVAISMARIMLVASFGLALVHLDLVYRSITSLKFATVVLTIVTLLCILGTLVVQSPPYRSQEEHEINFRKGHVGFRVNLEYLLGIESIPERSLFTVADEDWKARIDRFFGDQSARNYELGVRAYKKNQIVAAKRDSEIEKNREELDRLYVFLESIFATRIFKSYAFNSLLLLLAVSILAVLIKHYPFKKYEWGWVITHAGILTVLLGCAISDLWLKQGSVRMSPVDGRNVVDGFYDEQAGRKGPLGDRTVDDLVAWVREEFGGAAIVVLKHGEDQAELRLENGRVLPLGVWRQGRKVASGDSVSQVVAQWRDATYEVEPWVELPYRVEMTGARMDLYRELIIAFPEERDPRNMQPILESYPLRAGRKIELEGGRYRVEILDTLEHGFVSESWVPDDGAEPQPVAEIILKGPAGDLSVYLVAGDAASIRQLNNDLVRKHSRAAFHMDWLPSREAYEEAIRPRPESDEGSGAYGFLVLKLKGGSEERRLPVTPGEPVEVELGGRAFEVVVKEVARNYAQHEQKIPLERQDAGNPAVRVLVRSDGGDQLTWEFANFPGEGMSRTNPKVGVELVYMFRPPDRITYRVVAGPGFPPMLVKEELGGREVFPAEQGISHPLDLSGFEFRVGWVSERARRDLSVKPAEPDERGYPPKGSEPLIHIRFTEPDPAKEGESRTLDRWLRLFEDTHDRLDSADGRITIQHRRTKQQSLYESHVDVLTKSGDKVKDHVIRVNEPLVYKGYRFYQNNFTDGSPPISGLTVQYDAGIPLIYGGFLVICLGIVLGLWVNPLRRRRARARAGGAREVAR